MEKTITIRLSKKIQEELDSVAKFDNKSRSDIIREALSRYITLKKFQQIRKKVLPFAEAEGLLTDEDVFKAIS